MSQYQIAVVVGSLRRDSFDRKLANAVARLAPPEFSFNQVQIGGQPEASIQAKDGLFDEAGNIGAGSRQFLQTWMDRYAAWVKQHAAGQGASHAA